MGKPGYAMFDWQLWRWPDYAIAHSGRYFNSDTVIVHMQNFQDYD